MSGTIGYSNLRCETRIGSAVCAKRFTMGAQPSLKVLAGDADFEHLTAVGQLKFGNQEHDLDAPALKPAAARPEAVRGPERRTCPET